MGVAPRAVHEIFDAVTLKLSEQASERPESSSNSEDEIDLDFEELKKKQSTMSNGEEMLIKETMLVRGDSFLNQAKKQFSVYFSCVQIYNETMSDLLAKNQPKTLKLRQNGLG